mgnify:CR=1 FL=1
MLLTSLSGFLFIYLLTIYHQINHSLDRICNFLMTLDESIDLIENAISYGESGDFWIPQLRSMKIADLAEIFSERYNKPVVEIGIRPGEKLHESMISSTESYKTIIKDNFYIITPEIQINKNYEIQLGEITS